MHNGLYNGRKEALLALILYIIITALFIFVGGALLGFCWNLVIPVIFGPTAPTLGLIEGVAFIGMLWIIVGVIKD